MEDMTQAANPVEETEGIATPETETTETPNTEVQNVEDVTTTKVFSERLNAMTQKAIDAEYDRLYGDEYSIHSKADYDRAIAEAESEKQRQQFQEQNGFDPETIKPLFEQFKESDPDFQELKQIKAEKNATKALSDLNKELEDAGVDLKLADTSNEELSKLPNIGKINELMQTRKLSLAEAFFFANKNDIISGQMAKAQQETIKKISANGDSSPGSLTGGGEDSGNSVFSKSKGDFNKMLEEVLRGERKTL